MKTPCPWPTWFCIFWIGMQFGTKAQEYTFTTIAGAPGSSGNVDGTNTNARFYNPSEITVDASGVLYVSDLLNHTIRKVTPVGTNWVVTTIAGLSKGYADGTNSDARFDRPQGIKIDAAGRLFVADLTHTIRSITPSGTNWVVQTLAGAAYVRDSADGTNGNAHFYSPRGIAIRPSGDLGVVDSANYTIRGVTPSDTNWVVTTLAGTALGYGFADGINEWAEFNTAFGIAAIGLDLFVADSGNNAIRKIRPSGSDWVTTTIAGLSGIRGSADGPADQASFYFPQGIVADAAGNLYVTDFSNQTIRKLAAQTWEVTTLGGVPLQPGVTDGTGAQARFNHPWGITVDKAGNLFIADYGNHTIRKGTPSFVGQPALDVFVSDGVLVLYWPAAATQFSPEIATDLSPNAVWTPITTGISVVGGTCFLTNTAQGPAAFYRLHKSNALQ